jgi:electron transfer flavoprotein beta subunit
MLDIVVPIKQVPDLVEELEIDPSGTALDKERTRFVINELDDHALEQALLLKEKSGGRVSVIGLDVGEVEETLFMALAKGVDQAIKISGDFGQAPDSHTTARVLRDILGGLSHNLILTGVQAMDDLDGQLGILLSSYLELPYVGLVSGVQIEEGGGKATVLKELPGGVKAELELPLPAVLGIQAAEQPPRYVPVSRVRQAMRSATIEERSAALEGDGQVRVRRISKPEVGAGAELLAGSADEIAEQIAGILADRGLLK